jgi:hypothetical protein
MQPQPEGTSRVKLDEQVADVASGKTQVTKFTIFYEDPDYGKVSIGETHRVLDGKERGRWHAVSLAGEPSTTLEPFKAHNNAMAFLKDAWTEARQNGWAPPGSPAEAVPAPQEPVQAEVSPSVAVEVTVEGEPPDPTDGPAPGPEPASTGGTEAASSPVELPEMEGVPVAASPPEALAWVPAEPESVEDFEPPFAEARSDTGNGEEQAVIGLTDFSHGPDARSEVSKFEESGAITRVIPAGHPDDPDSEMYREQHPEATGSEGIPADELDSPIDWLPQSPQPEDPFARESDFPLG